MQKKKKLKVGILFGGKSMEHEVSLRSARNIFHALDKTKYNVRLVGIDTMGRWKAESPAAFEKPRLIYARANLGSVLNTMNAFDVIFPVLHGTFGEDGTVQGMLKLIDVPFVGPGVLGSAVGMDKEVAKRLLRDARIPVADFVTLEAHAALPSYESLRAKLGPVFFIKPANLGSSVGVHKVKTKKEFANAVHDAFLYDTKVLCEEFISGREIECAVMGNEFPRASVPGEIIPQHEFYSYEAKYLDDNGAELKIPAHLTPAMSAKIRRTAVKVFKVLACEGMARVDFFLKPHGELILNEINTIPGFTNISMYPKMWEASGISQKKLLDLLIQFARDRFRREKKLKTSFV